MNEIFQFLLLFSVFKGVSGVLCYECVSLNEQWCKEHFSKEDVPRHSEKLINCTTNCMKLIAHVNEEKEFYVRTCDITQGTPGMCVTASQVLGVPISTVCVCGTNRCNSTSLRTMNVYFVIFCTFLTILNYLFYQHE